jgi:hypothetical protein
MVEGHLVLYLTLGPNRGKVLVRDRCSATARALRVEAYFRRDDCITPSPSSKAALRRARNPRRPLGAAGV